MRFILPHGVAALLYAILAWHFWRTRWAANAPTTTAAWERVAILAALAVHSSLLYEDILGSQEFRFGFGQALSVMMWITVLIYWVESLFLRLDGMQPVVLGLAAICAPLPALFPGLVSPPQAQSFEFRLHMLLAMFAYSLFTVAALHGLLMTLMERRLHGRRPAGADAGPLGGPLGALPPLLTMEALLFRIIGVGFVLLTLTLATGIVNSEAIFGKAMPFNHKTIFAVASWFIFAALLGGRYFYGWRGRVALRWTLAGFVTLLLAYVGSRFVLEVILHRTLV